jgi:hypothetical protein
LTASGYWGIDSCQSRLWRTPEIDMQFGGHIEQAIPAAIYFVEGELEQEGNLQKMQIAGTQGISIQISVKSAAKDSYP